ncbi:MAG: flagellar protein FlaG [Alphaproteobacteria bacterium]|nr:flagellar protein FlaG [Alphaproteobacteria bacterium]
MDVAPNNPLSSPQPGAQSASSPAFAAGGVAPVQGAPDSVVTPTVSATDANAREDDALRRPSNRERDAAVASLQSLELAGLSTRIGFDPENEQVFLEILQPSTEEVIQRIPSEALVEFLDQQFDQLVAAGAGVEPVDTSA